MQLHNSVLTCACEQSIMFFFQAEDGIRDVAVTGVQTCALPISSQRGAAGLDYNLIVASYEQSRKVSTAAAESTRVNGNAADFKQWVSDVGDKDVALATDAKGAIEIGR